MWVWDSWAAGRFRSKRYARLCVKNDIKIWKSLFIGSYWRILLRFTWELPQTLFGFFVAQFFNYFSCETVVSVQDTLLIRYSAPALENEQAVSLAPFIVGTPAFAPQTTAFIHEFGHVLQSRLLGPLYLLLVGAPSILSALFAPKRHIRRVFETDASLRGYLFFPEAQKKWSHEIAPLPRWFYERGYLEKNIPPEIALRFDLKIALARFFNH